MKVFAPGKLNLGIRVLDKLNNGYHAIDTIMQSVNVYDELEFEKINSGIEIISQDEIELKDNLIYKAYISMRDYTGRDLPVRVKVKKNIPMAAGMAGGTSDGAFTMRALNELYDLKLSKEEMAKIGVKIGADFPFTIHTGTYRAKGIGEKLTKLSTPELKFVAVNPGFPISTKEVYENLTLKAEDKDMDQLEKAIITLNYKDISKYIKNDMEDYVLNKYKVLKEIKDELQSFGGISLLSGTGATVFGIFESEDERLKAYENLKGKYQFVKLLQSVGEV